MKNKSISDIETIDPLRKRILISQGFVSLSDLANVDEMAILRITGIGRRTLNALRAELHFNGFDFIRGDQEMKEYLKRSTELLENLYEYSCAIRRRVLDNPEIAMKGKFTYIPLDDLDDVMIQISQNYSALGIEKPLKRKKQ